LRLTADYRGDSVEQVHILKALEEADAFMKATANLVKLRIQI
jgi:hypothetical protein